MKGFDLQKTERCTVPGKPVRRPEPTWLTADSLIPANERLCVYVSGGDFEWHVLSPTAALLRVSQQQASGTQLRIQLMSNVDRTDWTRHIVWDLPVPKEGGGTSGISPVQMHRGDNGLIVFKGTSFKAAPTVTFDGAALEVAYDAKKKTEIGVLVPSSLTATHGHKELKATAIGSDKPVMLPIDVLE